MSGLNLKNIENSIKILMNQKTGLSRNINMVGDYDVNNYSEKVARIVVSHIDFINQNIYYFY